MRNHTNQRKLYLERLEGRTLLTGDLVISEFMASNVRTLEDDFGRSSDWIEIYNLTQQTVDLQGWALTDNTDRLQKWQFPAVALPAKEYLTVFASGRDRTEVDSPLHTNFKLSAGGEYLALVGPDGRTISTEFSPQYPPQLSDIAYGAPTRTTVTELVSSGNPAQITIPTSGDLGDTWLSPQFSPNENWITTNNDDTPVTTPIGFENDTLSPDNGVYQTTILADNPVGYWRLEETQGTRTVNLGSAGRTSDGRLLNNVRLSEPGVLPGAADYAAHFTQAEDQKIDVRYASALNPNSFTIEAWVRLDGGRGLRSPLTSRGDGRQGYMFYASANNEWEFWTGGGSRWNKVVGPTIQPGTWTHLVGTFDRANERHEFFVNGESVGQTTGTYNRNTTNPLRIGGGATENAGSFFFEGAIDEVAVYDYALRSSQVKQHFDLGKPLDSIVVEEELFFADFSNPQNDSLGPDAARLIPAGQSPQFPTVENPDGRLVLSGGGNGGVVFEEPIKDLTFDAPVSIRTVAFWERGQPPAADSNARFGLIGLHRRGTERTGPNRNGGLFAQFQPQLNGVADLRLGFQTDSPAASLDSFSVAMQVSGDGDFNPHGEFELELVLRGLEATDTITFNVRQESYAAQLQTTVADFRRALVTGSSVQQAFDAVRAELRRQPSLMNVGFLSTMPFGGASENIDAYRELRVSSQTISIEESTADYDSLLATDVAESMFRKNASAFLRIPFHAVTTDFDRLVLDMQYDDGFVAYLNGVEIARRNAPTELSWNSTAEESRPDSNALIFESIEVEDASVLLSDQENVLAVHGLNVTDNDSDFLINPKLIASKTTLDIDQPTFLPVPSPGRPTESNRSSLGPIIYDVRHEPRLPAQTDDIMVTANVATPRLPAASIGLTYRVMYGSEHRLEMYDDGRGRDVAANDGIYTGVIPGGVASPGQMVRYFVDSTDTRGNTFRSPRLETFDRNEQIPEYHGTVVADASIDTPLPVFQWFVPDPTWHQRRGGGNNENWSATSVFFNGDFYDNLLVRVRGLTTVSWTKPKFKFEFNDGYDFQFSPDEEAVDEFNLQSHFREAGAVSYMAETLAFEWLREIGVAAPLAFPMQIRQNGEFYSLATFVEQIDRTFLERNGFDPEGSMYKANSAAVMSTLKPNPSPTHYRKVTRKDEPFDDLTRFTNGINDRIRGVDRSDYLFDAVNLPQVINDMAGNVIMPNHDRLTKNYYVYRDVTGNNEWSRFPWDMDAAFARTTTEHFASVLYGDSEHPQSPNPIHQNHLYDAILDTPSTRDMYLRRVRTLIDQYMATGYFERQVDKYFDLLVEDADRDHRKWGAGNIRNGATRIKNNIAFRQRQLLSEGLLPRDDISIEHTTLLGADSTVSVMVPKDNSLARTWTSPSFDASSWTHGVSGVGFDNRRNPHYLPDINTRVEPKTECEDCTSFFVRQEFEVGDPASYNALTLRIKFDDGFIAYLNGVEIHRENFDGQPSWNSVASRSSGNELNYLDFDISGHLNTLRPGRNVLAIHALNATRVSTDMLIRAQILGGQTNAEGRRIDFADVEFDPPSGNQEEEYIEIRNRADSSVDISNWRIDGGIEYEFQAGTVIPAKGSLYVSPNVNAFRARTDGPTGGKGLFVQGDYSDHLDFGETITLYDDTGQSVATLQTDPFHADLNNDGQLDSQDISRICAAIHSQDARMDFTRDGQVDSADLTHFVQFYLQSGIGDANLDGVFDSRDFVLVFQSGEFQDDVANNSDWSEGDWNCDGEFNTSDLVFAFQLGQFQN